MQKLRLARCLSFLTIITLATQLAVAQSSAQQTTFAVAAIHQNLSDHTGRSHIVSNPHDGRLSVINVPLKMLLSFAFAVPESRISDLPSPVNSQKFDIQATSDPTIDAQLSKLDTDQAKLQKQLMLQALLADRFKLTWHNETRQLPVYNLVVAKNGSKLQESKAGGRTYNTGHGHLDDQGITLPVLADQLAIELGRPVVDQTNLAGRYDIVLKWTPDDSSPSAADSGPSIFTAIQEQLGLKLEPAKGPVPILVIDHIEPPTEN